MKNHLFAAAAEIESLTRTSDVWARALASLADEGIDVVLYLSSDPGRRAVTVLSNAPGIHAACQPADDPFLEWCCTSYDLKLTGAAFLDQHPYLDDRERAFIRAAADHGFRSGLALPMRLVGSARFGGFNLGTGLDGATFEATVMPRREALRFFCLVVHRKLEELGFDGVESARTDAFRARLLAPADGVLADLTPREREVIYLQAQGIPRKEVARMCGISHHTVAEYTAKAYRKLGINNRTQAARLVFRG